ncbi:MAG: SUMF1/EgtB/PvdO family nonheme iron enzyme [Planctomycetales bacterium]|nr:SUMF1/EgtB/PvdO family nonheme iron enzyme [Planctomycetales bacterium]
MPKHTNRRLLVVVGLFACVVLVGIVIQFSVRRGSPDPAGSADRRSPVNNEGASQTGDLRSSPSAGSGDPRTARGGWQGWPADAPPPAIAPFNSEQAEQHQEAWAKFLGVKVEYTNSLGMKFRLIPPGEFTMGSTPDEIDANIKAVGGDTRSKIWQERAKSETPQHNVILTQPFYLGVHEVTQADYKLVMETNPAGFSLTGTNKSLIERVAGMDTTRHPVEGASWNDAAEFCAKLSQREKHKPFYFRVGETVTPLEGTGYRLPSEAEWEFACRAGTTTKYWIGDKDEELMRAGWFLSNSSHPTNSGHRTHAVAELKENPFGLFDIHGNVFEWVQDLWEPTYSVQDSKTPAVNPTGSTSAGSLRVVRGGTLNGDAFGCRASNREASGQSRRSNDVGFRVSLPVDAVRESLKVTGPAMAKGVATTPSAPASDPIDFAAERKAAEALLKLNKGKTYLANDKTSWEMKQPLPQVPFYVSDAGFVDVDLTDVEIAVLAGCRGIIKLDARSNAKLTATGLKNVGPLPRLETLFLDETACARESLEFLSNYPRLSTLAMSGDSRVGIMQTLPPCLRLTSLTTPYRVGSVGAEGLKTIVRHCPQLTELNLNDSQELSLEPLSQLRTLQKLHCYGSHLSEAGIGTLAELPNLYSLGVDVPVRKCMQRLAKFDKKLRELVIRDQNGSGPEALTDAIDWLPITRFANLEQLTILDLIAVDAASLQAVAAMPRLKAFSVHNNITAEDRAKLRRYTADDITSFRKARPDVELHIDGKDYPATPDAPIDHAAERKAAEWALSVGATVELVPQSGEMTISLSGENGELPVEPFALKVATMFSKPAVTDDELARLRGCRRLQTLLLFGTPVTGFGLSHLADVRTLTNLDLSTNALSDTGLATVATFTQLRSLNLTSNRGLTDAALAHLRPLAQLETLWLDDLNITDAGVRSLSELHRLRRLHLATGPELTDIGVTQLIRQNAALELLAIADDSGRRTLAPLAQAPRLQSLLISGNQLPPTGLTVLQALPELRSLEIRTPLKPDELVRVSELSQLRRVLLRFLHGNSPSPGDEAFTTLARLPLLEEIDISGTQPSPSDTVLEKWAAIPHLKSVSLNHNEDKRRYTSDGIAAFRKARPDVQLNIDGKEHPGN